eukprot:11218283-Lingulodinium_polyedra.AAC.1
MASHTPSDGSSYSQSRVNGRSVTIRRPAKGFSTSTQWPRDGQATAASQWPFNDHSVAII